MTEMTMGAAIEILVGDEDLATPGSLYGRYGSDCAPVAYVLALVIANSTDAEMDEELLDYAMGLVVNSHPDVESLLAEHAGEVGWRLTDDHDIEPIGQRWMVVDKNRTPVITSMHRRENAESEAARLNDEGLSEFAPYRVVADTVATDLNS